MEGGIAQCLLRGGGGGGRGGRMRGEQTTMRGVGMGRRGLVGVGVGGGASLNGRTVRQRNVDAYTAFLKNSRDMILFEFRPPSRSS
jgi:hypothetical protein